MMSVIDRKYVGVSLAVLTMAIIPAWIQGQDRQESKLMDRLRAKEAELESLKQEKAELEDRLKADLNSAQRPATATTMRGKGSAFWPKAVAAAPAQAVGVPLPQVAAEPASPFAVGGLGTTAPLAIGWRVGGLNRESQRKISELARAIKESEDETEKEDLKDELKSELEKQYDTYLDSLEAPLKQMEDRLDKLREEFEKRKAAKEDLVKHRLDTVWYEANGMTWPGRGASGFYGPSGLFPNTAPGSLLPPTATTPAVGFPLPPANVSSELMPTPSPPKKTRSGGGRGR